MDAGTIVFVLLVFLTEELSYSEILAKPPSEAQVSPHPMSKFSSLWTQVPSEASQSACLAVQRFVSLPKGCHKLLPS
jgi:hypothetical protein